MDPVPEGLPQKDIVPIPKVLVYVITDGHLLVHKHADFPEAGVQVPGGTIDEGESVIEAARRELFEESGLTLDVVATIVHRELFHAPWNEQVYDRHFVTIDCHFPTHDFRHVVSKGAADKGLTFDFFWLKLDAAIQSLNFGHGAGLASVLRSFNHDL